jgi:DNA-binding transcriptional MerR regulator
MINSVKNSFSILDLEILSGIKAHTIRAWEKRYSILNPTRLSRNVRVYSLPDLQKLLNICLLQKHDYIISDLSKLGDAELAKKAKSISLEKLPNSYHINSLIVSMFSLDESLFELTYKSQIDKSTFKDVFVNTYLPLLNHIGLLWQTNGIKPAHEHFISHLIYQKIALNIAAIPKNKPESKEVYILFLPQGELHELGLLYLMYCLKLSGKKTIYLGRDIPTDDLLQIKSQFQEINWICSFLTNRTEQEKAEFVAQMENLLIHTKNKCWVIGKIWSSYSAPKSLKNLTFHERYDQLVIDE